MDVIQILKIELENTLFGIHILKVWTNKRVNTTVDNTIL